MRDGHGNASVVIAVQHARLKSGRTSLDTTLRHHFGERAGAQGCFASNFCSDRNRGSPPIFLLIQSGGTSRRAGLLNQCPKGRVGAEPTSGAKLMRIKELCDDGKLRERYRHKMQNAARHEPPIGFQLTFEEYCQLLRDAGIKSSQLGVRGYHLARYGDVGPYAVGNCRFVPYLVNQAEKKMDPEKVSAGLLRYYENHPGTFTGKNHSDETKRKIGDANSVSQAAERNSQYGTCWITRDGVNKRIKKEDKESYLCNGWSSGRVGNFAPKHPRNQSATVF